MADYYISQPTPLLIKHIVLQGAFGYSPLSADIRYAPRDSKGFIQFKSNTYGDWGPIRAFHTYKNQDEDRHLHYDTMGKSGEVPIPRKLDTFNETKWDDGVRQFLSDDIFALDKDVQPANTQVDPEVICTHSMHLHQATLGTRSEDGRSGTNGQNESVDVAQDSYATGFTSKLNLLESGLVEVAIPSRQPADRFGWFSQAPHGRTRSKLRIVILGFTVFLGFVAAAALSTFLSAPCRRSAFRS